MGHSTKCCSVGHERLGATRPAQAVYANGLKETWMIFGLLMGAYYNWTVVAPRLRVYTERLNVLTIPEYLEKRLQTKSPYLKIVSSLIILDFSHFTRLPGPWQVRNCSLVSLV